MSALTRRDALKSVGVAAGLAAGVAVTTDTEAMTAQGRIDRERTERLIDRARPLAVTFHRAFDLSRNLMESLDTLMEIGVDRILTSTGRPSVFDGIPVLGDLLRTAGDRVVILPGGGIRVHNVSGLLELPGLRELHIGASRMIPSSMAFRVEGVPMGSVYEPDEYLREEADSDVIRAIAAALDGHRVDGSLLVNLPAPTNLVVAFRGQDVIENRTETVDKRRVVA